jgi:bifunctional non-homologous end joining protein LigD
MSDTKKIQINKKSIKLSNLDKLYYPDKKYIKQDIIDYYNKIASYILPHIKNRPLVMQRFPDGINNEGFYQKEIPDYFPTWIEKKVIDLEKEGSQSLVVVEKKADLIYLVNQGTLIFHVWLCKKQNINKPDKIIFDLDPSDNDDFGMVKFAATKLKSIFEEKNLSVFVMTTGSKGLHVIMPIKPRAEFDKIRELAKTIAEELVNQYPGILTTELRKEKRKGRIFLDYLRNAFGQTTVAPYSLRAIKNAPIATPLDWSELPLLNDPQKYNLSNIFKRLGHKKDPWKDLYDEARNLKL